MHPFDGMEDTPQPPTTGILPASTLAAIANADHTSEGLAPKAVKTREGDDDFVIGLFNPRTFGAALREEKFTNAEMVKSLVSTIRTGLDKDKMAAIRLLTSLGKETLTLNGKLTTATVTQESTDASGSVQKLELSQVRLQAQLRDKVDPNFGAGEGITIQRPLTQEEINDSNLLHPDKRAQDQKGNIQASIKGDISTIRIVDEVREGTGTEGP